MKVVKYFIAIFLVGIIIHPADAATVKIPADFAAIQDGIDAASNLDTVLVAPGTYRVNLDFKGKTIVLTSEAGPLLTKLKPYISTEPIVLFENSESPLAILEQFTLSERYSKPAVQIYNSSPTIRDNIFTGNEGAYSTGIIYIRGNSSSTVQRNLFYNNPDTYTNIWEDSDSPTFILNNTIYGGREGLVLWGVNVTAYGNIVTDCSMGVSAVAGATTAYNNIWGNSTDWIYGSPDPLDLSVDPEYVDAEAGNFYLMDTSPMINAGYPAAIYYDPDGTINDIGAIPFDHRTPLALDLHLENYALTNVLEHYPTFYWHFYDPTETQAGFELEVGTDDDWTTAENWATGEIIATDTFVTYAGAPLDNGSVSYYRVRVYNGSDWGIWTESVFRINSIPSEPVLLSPIDQESISRFGVRLSIENSVDAEGDDLTYDFEIYSDPGLTTLITEITNLPGGNGTTTTDKIADLAADTEYWWRARAFDGYEYSVWSDPESFITRAPIVLHVPSEYANIQAGIDAAEEGDTVLVADNTYTGDGNRDLNFNGVNIVLLSENGRDATIIDCAGSTSDNHIGFVFENYEDSTSVVDGFTVTNAYAPMVWNEASIVCNASPTIKNCIISGNEADGFLCGGGSEAKIIDCIIADNTGAGVRSGWSQVKINGCLIAGNGEDGFNINYGGFELGNCTFANNAGIGIVLYGDPPKLNARAAEDSAVVYNCITYNNDGGGIAQYFYYFPDLKIYCTDSYGNSGDNWLIYTYGAGDEFGNISSDPYFCDAPSGDFGLGDISPCAPDNNECGSLIGAFEVTCTITDLDEKDSENNQKPEEFVLSQNYPNPFNPSTVIEYFLPSESEVEIVIYNMIGQKIKTIIDGQQTAGSHSVYWDGTDTNGRDVASGLYLYRIRANENVSTKKMMLLR